MTSSFHNSGRLAKDVGTTQGRFVFYPFTYGSKRKQTHLMPTPFCHDIISNFLTQFQACIIVSSKVDARVKS